MCRVPWEAGNLLQRLHSLKRRLGKTRLSDGKGIGGRGRLTDKVIDNLQVYYGQAIRNNTHIIEDMENAVLAIWHHTRSTDANPDHDLCPQGETSWCGYQRELAKNTQELTVILYQQQCQILYCQHLQI